MGFEIPYFWEINKDKDFTLTGKLFSSEHPLFLGEYRQAFKNSNLIFDIGANIGQYMLFFSEFSNKQSKIISFEPNKDVFKLLEINRIINCNNNVTSRNIAIGAYEGKVSLGIDSATGGRSSSTEQVDSFLDSCEVDQSTLDKIFNQYGIPDFIKVDVEGAEINIFNIENIHKLNKTKLLIEVRENTKEFIFNIFDSSHDCRCIESNCLISHANEIPSFANLVFIPSEPPKSN
jgi:FkbM family methyltransferase